MEKTSQELLTEYRKLIMATSAASQKAQELMNANPGLVVTPEYQELVTLRRSYQEAFDQDEFSQQLRDDLEKAVQNFQILIATNQSRLVP